MRGIDAQSTCGSDPGDTGIGGADLDRPEDFDFYYFDFDSDRRKIEG